ARAMKEAAPARGTRTVPAGEADWRRLVERVLDSRPFDSLVSTTFDGLKITPLYPRATSEGARALRQKPGPWTISQRMDHPEPETANAMARADLIGGADALTLTISQAHAARGFGARVEGERDLDAALAEIELDLISLRIDAGPRALDIAPAFASMARNRRLTSAILDVDFGHDPVGHLAWTGVLPPGRGVAEMHKLLRGAGFAGHLFLADGRPYHEAGAGEAQELGCVISTGVEYLRLLEAEGLSLDDARSEIAFLLAADADEFLSLAKFRALRLLWARIESASGLAPKPIRLHAETGFRMMTKYDPFVNILRATMAVFCAGVGGADAVTVLPFTLVLGLPDEFARRVARNMQLILIHEAKLAKVADPAAGAGSFEALTEELCARAWSLFQNFEAQGGMIASLRAGVPQSEIAAAAAARRDAVAQRTLAITGTSAFPLLAEAPVNVLEPAPAGANEARAAGDCVPLSSRRDAEPYEILRAAAEERFHKTGERPKIFLAHLGRPQGFAAASAYAANFFAAAGIEAASNEGFETALEVADAFRASGCKIACICASKTISMQTLIEAARALRGAGAARVYLAGRESEGAKTALLEVGVAEFICAGSDTLAILEDTLAVALGERQS
ncbi:MAG TPA: methylmalonyl-CoA mutase subunit beta, partial [Methylocella sp.]|nr:methylmalonyl-CoA mutase subunit beta [Methylocella sp.]